MSADGHTVCVKCHPDLVGVPGITDNSAEDLGYDRSVREQFEFYTLDGNKVVASYRALCWDCGFEYSLEYTYPIPLP